MVVVACFLLYDADQFAYFTLKVSTLRCFTFPAQCYLRVADVHRYANNRLRHATLILSAFINRKRFR